MPILDFASDTYIREGFRLPQARTLNMYSEATPSGPNDNARFPRYGTSVTYTNGTGPYRSVFYKSGVLSGNVFSVSGTEFYKDSTLVGTISGTDIVYMDGSNDQLGIVANGNLYCYDGTTLSQISYFYARAKSTFTLSGNPSNGETVTIGAKTYTFKTVLSTANDILIGANASLTLDYLISAIMTGGTGNPDEGTKYGTGTIASTTFTAVAGAGDTMDVTAVDYGTAGMLAVSDTCANGSWSSGTLTGLEALPSFTGIAFASDRFYLTVSNSDRFYWSNLSDLTQIDALSFATAESAPDINTGIARLADEIWFFGAASVEPWYQTGNADAPLQRSRGRRYEKGCLAPATIVAADNTLFFVGSDNLVYRSGAVPTRISTHAIESAIERASDISLLTAYLVWFSGHTFYVLNVPDVGSYAFDISTSTWAEWSTYGYSVFLPRFAAMKNGTAYMGSSIDGKMYSFDKTSFADDGANITYLVSAFLQNTGNNMTNFSLMCQCTRGLGSVTDTTPPVVEMRYSDDAGQTFNAWRSASLGAVGQYYYKAIWRRLGQVSSPGRLYQLRVTQNVPIVFEYLQYNQGTP